MNNIDKAKEVGKKVVDTLNQTIEEIKNIISHDCYDYIEKYGDLTFKEKKFTDIDNIIFSMLAYVDFRGILNENDKKKKISEVSKDFFLNKTKEEINNSFFSNKEAAKILEIISNKKRYKDILVFNYLYIKDKNTQFSAITFDLRNNYYYVAFEGTDEYISGWKEDCQMAYEFPVRAHNYAIKYLRKYTFNMKKLIIGGHSKGGNLALVSSMYTNFLVRFKIKKIYSNDGQGLRSNELETKRYKRVEKKYIHIIPNFSMVGLFLRNRDNFIVVKTNKVGIIAHNPTTWQIIDDKLELVNLSRSSKVFREGFNKWLDKYDMNERELFVKNLFSIIEENNIETLLQFKENYKLVFDIIKSSKDINPIVKDMSIDLLKVMSKTNLEYPLL